MLGPRPSEGFKPRCASAEVPLPPPKAQHPCKHGGETLLWPQEPARDCFLGSLSGWQTWDGAGRTLQVRALLAPALIAFRSDMRGEAGTSSGITLGPGVLLRRSSGDIFVRAMVPLGTLLAELEEFCCTSLKTSLLLLKHRGPGVLASDLAVKPKHCSRCSAGWRVGAAFSPFPPARKKWLSSTPGRATTEMEKASVLPEEDTTLPWFSQLLLGWHSPPRHLPRGMGRPP